jgi:phospholipid/cholesterol/gamma-HCH transport system permease protein
MTAVLHELGGLALFLRELWRTFWRTSGNTRPIIAQMAYVSFRSLSTVAFAGLFVGAILVLQFNLMLQQYEAQTFLGGLNTSAVVREVGPLIISFLLAGKIGAFTAAELGTMRVTEQIDAIECLGTNPLQYLVLPRFIAIILSSVILLMIGLMVSILGAMLVARAFCGINFLQYTQSIPRFTGPDTLFAGMFRSAVYGTIVAGVACYKGYTATGGARGVGRAVTLAAIYTNLYIVIANFMTGAFLDFTGNLFSSVLAR